MKADEKTGTFGPPAFEATAKTGGVFVEPSAAGESKNAHEAREGVVTNPGVRKVSTATLGPRCPVCNEATLKMRMNRKAGQRAYCSNPNCSYDQSTSQVDREGGIKPNQNTRIIDAHGSNRNETGVKIVRQSRMR